MQLKNRSASTQNKHLWQPILAGGILAIGALTCTYNTFAAEPGQPAASETKSCFAQPATLASKATAAHHLAKAAEYETQAKQLRTELKQLWKNYRTERNKIAVLPKMVGENPYVKKLRLKTEKAANALELQISETEDMARHHRNRAREVASE